MPLSTRPWSRADADSPAGAPARRPAASISLKGRALRLLSGREYSRPELERRLQALEETPGDLAAALDDLQAKGFISEQRVIESVINRRQAKLGTARIRQELQTKGLDRDAVLEAVAGLQATELERARALWQRKFGAPATEPKERGKQMRFLASRGFGGDTIRRVISGAADDG
jgi:regulatory protein